MENLYFAVIPSQAGIQWLQVLRDPRLRGDDGKLVFFDTRARRESLSADFFRTHTKHPGKFPFSLGKPFSLFSRMTRFRISPEFFASPETKSIETASLGISRKGLFRTAALVSRAGMEIADYEFR